MDLMPTDWGDVFAFEAPLLETVARGALLYLAILLMLRVLPRRTAGELAPMDLVLILLVTESASHALGDFTSLGDGLLQIVVVMLLNLLVNVLSYRFRAFEKLVNAPSLEIVRDGRIIPRNLRREFITRDELDGNLRKNNIDDIAKVKSAFVEGEGHITFVLYEDS